MATPLSTATSASVKTTAHLPHYSPYPLSRVSLRLSPKPNFRFAVKDLQPSRNTFSLVRAQPNEVRFSQWFSFEDLFSNLNSFLDTILGSYVAFKAAVDRSSNSADPPSIKSEIPSQEAKDDKKLSGEPSTRTLATEESISEFIAQITSLVKLVDSRDIMELHMKQRDCELIIRKKEALPQPSPSPPVVMMHPPSASPMPSAPPAASPPASSPPSSAPPQSPSPPASKSSKSSLPPLKCPMAGTFYRSPAPGEPPFVKVGDKVQKGQVLCIIEAMKLMNEIEADQSGTIVEILVEDRKAVSVDTPLFVLEP